MRHLTSFPLLALLASCASPITSSPAPAAPTAVPDPAALKSLHVVIIGDSTVCNWPLNDSLHRSGWGMHLAGFLSPALSVSNLALSGRSTKTFISEGHWAKALAEQPDVVLIQFGHNDSHATANPEATSATGDFRDYLRRYIDETRAIGGTPVLVTPMCRRTPTDNLGLYADAMKSVAAEQHVAVIDLHATSAALYAKLGDRVTDLAANPRQRPV